MVPVSPARKRPAPPKARKATPRTPVKSKQRRYQVQNPVQFRSPVLRNKKRPKRKTTIGIGSVVFAILAVTAYVVVGVVAAVVTGLITGVATGIAASRSEPATPKARQQGVPTRPTRTGTPATPKTPPPGSVMCGAPTRGGGKCMRSAMPGQNCGIPSHPAPGAAA